MLVVATVVVKSIAALRQPSDTVIDSLVAFFYVTNWVQAFELRARTIFSHTWSLSVEEQFYILWPAILMLLLRLKLSRSALAMLVLGGTLCSTLWRASMVGSVPIARMYEGLDTRADVLLIGCAIGLWLSGGVAAAARARTIVWVRSATPIVLISIVPVLCFVKYDSRPMLQLGYLIAALASGVLVIDIVFRATPWLNRMLCWPLVVYVGRISYGLYLWHWPVMKLVRQFGSEHGVRLAGVLPVYFILSAALAVLSYELLEKRVLRLKAFFPPQPSGNRSPAQPTAERASATVTAVE
jgi:peptidoglycan/LPS O-acetylase OafA/YrhL